MFSCVLFIMMAASLRIVRKVNYFDCLLINYLFSPGFIAEADAQSSCELYLMAQQGIKIMFSKCLFVLLFSSILKRTTYDSVFFLLAISSVLNMSGNDIRHSLSIFVRFRRLLELLSASCHSANELSAILFLFLARSSSNSPR